MKQMWLGVLLLGMGLGLGAVSCGDDDDNGAADGDADTDTDTDADGDSDLNGTIPNGEFCHDQDHCISGFCDSWRQAPADPDAVCTAGPDDGKVRLMGTIVDLETRQPIPGIDIGVAEASSASFLGDKAVRLASATGDGDGRFDITIDKSVIDDPFGIVALAKADGYYVTSTGLSEPDEITKKYPSGTDEHDVLLVSESPLAKWSALLAGDPALAPYIPLGDKGGVIGSVVSKSMGTGIAGAKMVSRAVSSSAIILYPNADNSALVDSTSSTGIFIILNPGMAEDFDTIIDGKVATEKATVGTTPNMIFAVSMLVVDF